MSSVAPPAGELLVTNARLFVGVNESVIDNGALWVRDGVVRFAGSMAELPDAAPLAGALDAGGKFVMPGMTETHAHLQCPSLLTTAIARIAILHCRF